MMIDLIRPYPGEDEVSFIKRKAYFIRVIQPRLEYSGPEAFQTPATPLR